MCETLRAELKLSFKFSTLDLTIVGAHYDVPNDSQPQELGCIYMSPAHQSSILSSIKSIIFVFVAAFSTPLYLCPMNRLKIC